MELAGVRVKILVFYYGFLDSLRLCRLESHSIIRTKLRVVFRLINYLYLGASFQLFIFLLLEPASVQYIDSEFLKTLSEWIFGLVSVFVCVIVVYCLYFITLILFWLYIIETSLIVNAIWVFGYYIHLFVFKLHVNLICIWIQSVEYLYLSEAFGLQIFWLRREINRSLIGNCVVIEIELVIGVFNCLIEFIFLLIGKVIILTDINLSLGRRCWQLYIIVLNQFLHEPPYSHSVCITHF
jgi:hypothetical protein